MSSLYACVLCFLLALLNPVSLSVAANVTNPLTTGFNLPLVSNHRDLDHAAGELQEVLSPEGAGANLTNIRPKITPVGWPMYSVLVGVGTGQNRHWYKLALDFIGNLTWMQCQPCVPELRQEGPIFNSGVSPHYEHVLPTSRYCRAPYTRSGQDRCSFNVRFRTTTIAHGYLGTDVFAFAASGSGDHVNSVDGLVFGCAHTTHGFVNHDVLAGVMSFNRHPTSFARQLTERLLTNSRFSYCLFFPSPANARHGFLRFGRDIPQHHAHAQNTALVYEGNPGVNLYYVRVVGISVNGRRITRITPAMLQRDPRSRRGGCIIDVGTPLTRVVRAAYDILIAEVAAHLRSRGVHPVVVPGYRLCVRGTWPEIRAHAPSVTLHFYERGAELAIKPQLLFITVTHAQAPHMCFAIAWDEEMTVLGARQQVDTRFTFDLAENRLYFAPENCHGDTRATA